VDDEERRGGGPPVVGGGAIWSLNVDGGRLYALDPPRVALLASISVGALPHFASPTLWDGWVLIGTMSGVVAVKALAQLVADLRAVAGYGRRFMREPCGGYPDTPGVPPCCHPRCSQAPTLWNVMKRNLTVTRLGCQKQPAPGGSSHVVRRIGPVAPEA